MILALYNININFIDNSYTEDVFLPGVLEDDAITNVKPESQLPSCLALTLTSDYKKLSKIIKSAQIKGAKIPRFKRKVFKISFKFFIISITLILITFLL